MPAAVEILRAARLHVSRACDLLRSPSPTALDACAEALENAVAALLSGCPMRPPDLEASAEAHRLQAAVNSAVRLLQSAADYHLRWAQMLGTLTAGYTPAGEAAAVAHPRRICLSG
jgi:hypothetical protein